MPLLSSVSKKSVVTVLFEAIIVGIVLVLLVYLLRTLFYQYIPNISGNKQYIELLFIAGALFHIIFEYTGLNMWHSKEYCKLL
jgi:hypothetical protein